MKKEKNSNWSNWNMNGEIDFFGGKKIQEPREKPSNRARREQTQPT